jgi:hypothetical protein
MDELTFVGSLGLGLVWGWLAAGLGGGARGTWGFRLALVGLSLLAGIAVWTLAGGKPLIGSGLAAALAMVLRLAWHHEIAVRSRAVK